VKHLFWIAAGVLITAGLAAPILRQTTGEFHLRELGIVTAIILISSQVAMIPLLLTRGASPVAVFQAAFGGTVIHLFLSLALGAAVHSMGWAGRGLFLFLLLGFYWFSLSFVITAMIKIFRQSVPQPSHGGGQQTMPAKGM
jgi:hypothetical protein